MTTPRHRQPGRIDGATSPIKLGLVSQWFAPERGSAAIATVIARQLQASGFDLHVITGLPNYPTGEIYPGYRIRPAYCERVEDLLVRRVPLYANHEPRAIPRMANYLSFAASATVDALRQFADRDVILVHGTPATVAIPAMALRETRGIPYVLHVQDLWPDTVTASGFIGGGVGRVTERALHRFCDASYRLADHIAVTSPGMIEPIMARGVAASKLSVVTNWADEEVFVPAEPDARLATNLGITRAFNLMYAGNLGPLQELETLLDAAASLRDDPRIGVVLVGDGADRGRLEEIVAERDLDNVTFVGQQPMSQMRSIMALGDVHYVGLSDLPIFRTTMPSKLQATLAAGRPVIAALTGDAAATVTAAGAGAVVKVGDGPAVAKLARQWVDDPGRLAKLAEAGRAYYRAHFSSAVSSARLTEILTRVAENRRSKR